MVGSATSHKLAILDEDFHEVIVSWMITQGNEDLQRRDLFLDGDGREHASARLKAFAQGVRDGVTGESFDLTSVPCAELRSALSEITMERVRRGRWNHRYGRVCAGLEIGTVLSPARTTVRKTTEPY